MANVKHKSDCKMSFGRKDPSCPRCQELLAGAPAIKWASTRRAEEDARRSREIREHDCRVRKCGPVCTAFDW